MHCAAGHPANPGRHGLLRPRLGKCCNVEAYLGHFSTGILESGTPDSKTSEHYVNAFSDQARLRASFEDYRTGFSTDLDRDHADYDRGLRVQVPLFTLWGTEGTLVGTDVVRIWQEHHADPRW
ncbi:hypothetical protein [Nocardia terpenica]|uniref:Uncharacterized protein n=1 Tax=Nocardia terpenica TaxID=455432 RepID=A0A6G9YXG1_9NOCA|nr:hypothetical protein [Nocardia terpenica]QIS17686.1 hypothetical protein F6W96_04550 [Nocardia terpenica]